MEAVEELVEGSMKAVEVLALYSEPEVFVATATTLSCTRCVFISSF